MSLISTITGLFSGDGLGKVVDGILDKIPDAGAKAKARLEWEKESNQATQALLAAQVNETKAYLKDVADARAMQVAALGQDDKFSKRFIYFLTAFIIVLGMVYIFLVTFCDIPEKNQRMADTVLGFLLGTMIASILNYFYGSTKASNDKTNQIVGLANNKNNRGTGDNPTVTVEAQGTAKTTIQDQPK